jgi:hypothetical protein
MDRLSWQHELGDAKEKFDGVAPALVRIGSSGIDETGAQSDIQ